MSIVCIIFFIVCYTIGLGPIPFIYVAECFKPNAKSAGLAVCILVNWFANLLVAISFEYLARLLNDYVFLVFTVIVGIALLFIFIKVPETKNKSTDEILFELNGKAYDLKLPQEHPDRNELIADSK